MDFKQIGKALRIDVFKILAYSNGSVWLLVLLPLVFAVVPGMMGKESVLYPMSGAVTGMLTFVSAMAGMSVFSYEDQTGSAKLNGLLPVSRRNQVVGRYAFALLVVVVAVVLQMICGMMMFRLRRMGAVAGLMTTVLVASPILAGIYLPIGYRFPATKAVGYAIILLFVIGGALVLVAFTVPDAVLNNVMDFVTSAKLGPIPWVAIIGILVAAVIFVLSCRLSMHIYERKEL
ncbi:ABC-2 transporter permease [Bifidobacterium sp. ESL0704]|uniref:ABC-2 transporter permease n=1 Tax=Bifidobacterium sp. ESL0704 TaxID=2983219 RepID=UPI0023F9800B|nr:ABC-2 transporter permease [Bifidobacterium sp. ESL0704]WEV52174.1 ABC-2 transporter permease [Bifidobacterium sp. ESL0704]